MQIRESLVALSFALLSLSAKTADAGVAVVIDRASLRLVSAQSTECPSQSVIFVTRGGRVVAVCDTPPPAAGAVRPADGQQVVAAPLAPAMPPTWRIAEAAEIRTSIAAWLPEGWRLAWDTEAAPTASVPFEFQGEPMEAIADLFDRRSVWGDAPLIACAFGAEKILQVRDRGECGQP